MKLEFDEAIQIMRKMHSLIDEVIAELGDGLNHFEFKMLFMIEKKSLNTIMAIKEDAIKQHKSFSKEDIAKFEVKISKMSKDLIDKGLITLERNDDDARCKKIIVTPKGKELIKKIDTRARQIWKELNND